MADDAIIQQLLLIQSRADLNDMEKAIAAQKVFANETEKSTASLTHNAREMQHAEDAGRAFSDLLRGNLSGALIDSTRGLGGFTALLAESPVLVAAIGLPVLIELFRKVGEAAGDSAEVVKKREEEVAKNTEQTAKRIEESMKHPGMAEYGLQVLEIYEKIAAATERTAANMERIQSSANKAADALDKLHLAQLNAAEQQAIADAQAAGKSPNDIAIIRQNFADQRTALTGANETAAAQREVEAAQLELENKKKEGTQAVLGVSTAAQQMAEHQAESQATMDALTKQYNQDMAQMQARLARAQFLAKPENFDALRSASLSEIDDVNTLRGLNPDKSLTDPITERTKLYQAQVAQNANAQAPVSQADAEKLAKANDALEKSQTELKVAINNLTAAQTNLLTAQVKAGGNAAAQAGSDAEFNRLQQGGALAGSVEQMAGRAYYTPGLEALRPLLLKLIATASTENQDPSEAHFRDFATALVALDANYQRLMGRTNKNVDNLTDTVKKLLSQYANGRDRQY